MMSQDAKPVTLVKSNKLFDFPGGEDVKINVNSKDILSFRDGDIIYQIHDDADHIYLILEGAAKIKFSVAIDGQRIFERGTGEFFGEREFMEKTARTSSAVAIKPTRVYMLRRKDLNDLISKYRQILNTLQGIAPLTQNVDDLRATRETVSDDIAKMLQSSESSLTPYGYKNTSETVRLAHEEKTDDAPEPPMPLKRTDEKLPGRFRSTFEDSFTFQNVPSQGESEPKADDAQDTGFSWDFSKLAALEDTPAAGEQPAGSEFPPAAQAGDVQSKPWDFNFEQPPSAESAETPPVSGFNWNFTNPADPVPPAWGDDTGDDEVIKEFEFDDEGNLIPSGGKKEATQEQIEVPEDLFKKFRTSGIIEPAITPAPPQEVDRDKLFEDDLTGAELRAPEGAAAPEPQFGQSGFQFTAPLEVRGQQDKPAAPAKVQQSELTKEQLHKLIEASKLVNSNIKIDEVLNSIVLAASSITNADRGTLYIVDQQAQELWSKIIRGDEIEEIRLRVGQGLAGWVAKTAETVNIKDASKDERFDSNIDKATGYKTRSMLCFPIKNKDGVVVAVIQLLNSRKNFFSEIDELFLDALSSHIAIALANAELLEQLLRTDRLASLGKMAKFLISDIKKPILTIKQFTEHIRKKNVSPEVNQVLALTLEQANIVVDLVLTTLSYSEGKTVLNKKVIGINRVLEELIDLLAEYVEFRKAKLFKKFATDVLVSVDRRELYQAFFQVAKNACDAMQQGGELYVSSGMSADGKNVEISFRDTGVGIPAAVKEKIFEPFYVNAKPHGVGLGLPIAQKVLRDHGGDIRVDSVVGQGTTVTMTLPVVSDF